MDRNIAPKYIQENFDPFDRLAVVLLNKRTGAVTQRIAFADRIGGPEFQAWLRHKNAEKNEIYISMNVLRSDATGRTKNDIAAVRHLYLDFDEKGTEAVERLMRREDMPRPNYRLSSSPGKWQVVWKAAGFAPEQAERLQKWRAREAGADPAATDSARVLRLPGFYNHKYEKPHFITAETLADRIYLPEDFAECWRQEGRPPDAADVRRGRPRDTVSQSERDWAYAKRALARGEPQELVIAAIAGHRRHDKPDPQYYAELTVENAARELKDETLREPPSPSEPTR